VKRLIRRTGITLAARSQAPGQPLDLEISAAKTWTDTRVDVVPGNSFGGAHARMEADPVMWSRLEKSMQEVGETK
jgi:hypothetical protein